MELTAPGSVCALPAHCTGMARCFRSQPQADMLGEEWLGEQTKRCQQERQVSNPCSCLVLESMDSMILRVVQPK